MLGQIYIYEAILLFESVKRMLVIIVAVVSDL